MKGYLIYWQEPSTVLKDTITVVPVLSLTLGDLRQILSGPQSSEVPATQKRLEDLGVTWRAFPDSPSTTWEAQPQSGVLAGQ